TIRSSSFFLQAEDGIRDWSVTGVQTCALPISIFPATHDNNCKFTPGPLTLQEKSYGVMKRQKDKIGPGGVMHQKSNGTGQKPGKIGRASCRERGENSVGEK